MQKPFGLISDTHHHAWSAFSTTLPTGVNSRLQIILDETLRAARVVKAAGGDTLYHGGDLFHVRGSIAPSVLNPTLDCYAAIEAMGVHVILNAGNHDLEAKEAARVSSAITALEGIGCTVINGCDYGAFEHMVIIPWMAHIGQLKAAIEYLPKSERAGRDLLLHAPVDGVMAGLPGHGLTDTYLADLGYRRVFAGHYHHHKDFGNGVFSIGALTQQTWRDVNTQAGFLIVDDKAVNWHASHAPSFVEVEAGMDATDIALLVDGHYARVRLHSSKTADVEAMRQFLFDSGAQGGVVLAESAAGMPARTGAMSVLPGASLEASIHQFIDVNAFANASALKTLCADILASVQSVAS